MISFTLRSFILFLLFLKNLSLSHQTCFNQGGDSVDNDRPCFPDQELSFCCGDGFTCLENFICEYNGSSNLNVEVGTLARGTCTDSTWESPSCPRFCMVANPHVDGNFINDCHNGTGCCKIDGIDCSCLEGASTFVNFTQLEISASEVLSPSTTNAVAAMSGPSNGQTATMITVPVPDGVITINMPLGSGAQIFETALTFQETLVSTNPTSSSTTISSSLDTTSSPPTTDSSSTTPTVSSSGSTSSTTSSFPTSTNSNAGGSGGGGGRPPLSTGEIVGIAIGAFSALVTLIAALIGYLAWKKPKTAALIRTRRPHVTVIGRRAATALHYFK